MRRGFLHLSCVLPTSCMFTSGYVNMETILHFFIQTFDFKFHLCLYYFIPQYLLISTHNFVILAGSGLVHSQRGEVHGLAPEYLCSKFTWRDSAYDLRDSENKLNVPLPRTNYYRKSFSYNGATLWNSLPCDIRNTESLGVFKRKINDIL